jgi:hypothetical protein
MIKEELVKLLEKVPDGTKVLISSDTGAYELEFKDVAYRKAYIVWRSDYNNNKRPWVGYDDEERNFVYERGNGLPDYVVKTIGEEFVLYLG